MNFRHSNGIDDERTKMKNRLPSSRLWKLAPLLLAVLVCVTSDALQSRYLVYVGTYTEKDSKGIYAYRFDPATGETNAIGLVAATDNPSFLAVAPNNRLLYAVNELDKFDGKPTGAVSAFAIDRETGKLKLLQQVSSLGGDPAHLSLDKTGPILAGSELRRRQCRSIPYRIGWPPWPAHRLHAACGLQRKSGATSWPACPLRTRQQRQPLRCFRRSWTGPGAGVPLRRAEGFSGPKRS